ncbi:MAG: MarR family winged helix-turn-helix transcriptional regulator [Chloroflexota bacterium]
MVEREEAERKDQLVAEIVSLAEPIYEYLMVAHVDAWSQLALTMPQFKVLSSVAVHGRIDSPYLVRRLSMLPSTLTRIVDRLVERDLVRRRADSKDRRVVFLEATPEGTNLVKALTASTLPKPLSDALHNLTADELAQVCQGLRVLGTAIGRPQRPTGSR